MGPIELTEARAVLAALGFALLPASWRRPAEPPTGGGTSSGLAVVVALGVALALVNGTYFSAVSRIPVAAALVIQYTAPALIVGWTSLRLRRAPSRDVATSLVAAMAGCVLVVDLPGSLSGRVDGLGVGLAVTSAFFFAAYTVLAAKAGARYGPSGAMLRGFAVAAGLWTVYQAPRGVPEALFERANLPEVVFVGVAGTLLPFLCYAWALRRVRAERAAIAATLEPVIAAVIAWLWLGQRLSATQVAGGLLVIAAVAGLQRSARAFRNKTQV